MNWRSFKSRFVPVRSRRTHNKLRRRKQAESPRTTATLWVEPLESMDLLAAAVWTGGGANGNWSNAANWQGGVAPVAGSDLVFGAAASKSTNNDLASGTTFNSITFAANGYTLNGNALTLNGGINNTASSGGGTNTLNLANIAFTAAATINRGGPSTNLIIGSNINIGGSQLTFTGMGSGQVQVGGQITGSGGLTMLDSGAVTLTSNNTYNGATSINGGNLTLSGGGAILTSNSITLAPGGKLTLDNAGANNLNRLSDGATLTFHGGTFELVGNSTINATETVGTICLADSHSVIISGSPSSQGTTIIADTLSRNSGATVDFLNGGSSFSLGSTLNRIIFTGTSPTLSNSIWAFAYVNGQDFATYGANGVAASSGYASAFISNPAANVKIFGNQTLTANTTIHSLVLANGATLALDPGVILTLGSGSLIMTDTASISGGNLTLGNEGIVAVTSGLATISSQISGSGGLTKTSIGKLSLSANNLYYGGTKINEGVLAVGVNANLGDSAGAIRFWGGALQVCGTFPTARPMFLDFDGTIDVLSGFTFTVNGQISGLGALNVTDSSPTNTLSRGTLDLTQSNNYSGGTRVNGSILSIANDGRLGAAGGELLLNDGKLIVTGSDTTNRAVKLFGNSVINVSSNQTLAVTGSISGNGAFTKQGQGTLALTGTSNFDGATRIDAGRLEVSGSLATTLATVAAGATLAGSTINGPLKIDPQGTLRTSTTQPTGILNAGEVTFSPGSTFAVTIDGTTPGGDFSGSIFIPGYDQLVTSGPIDLNGATLSTVLNVLNSSTLYTPVSGDSLTIIKNNSGTLVEGMFVGLPEGSKLFSGANMFVIHYNYNAIAGTSGNDVVLVAMPAPKFTSVVATSPLGGVLPDTILVKFQDADLHPTQAANAANYTLEYAADGVHFAALPLAAPQFSGYGNRVVLHVAGAGGSYATLQEGAYRLTVQGVQNAWGTPMAGTVTRSFTVTAQQTQADHQSVLNEMVDDSADSLETYVTQSLEQAKKAHEELTDPTFAMSLVTGIQTTISTTTGDSAAVAAAVNAQITQSFNGLLANYNPGEYLVIWGVSQRFLLTAPAGNQIGFVHNSDESFTSANQIPGAVLVSNLGSVPPQVSAVGPGFIELAIVPIQAANSVISTSSLIQSGGTHLYPNLSYEAKLEGLAATNQGGVVYFSPGKAAQSEAFVNQSTTTVTSRSLNTSGIMTGLSPLVDLFDDQVMAELERLFGDFDNLSQNFLVVWFDPVDFVLTDSQGNSVSLQNGQTTTGISNAFFSVNPNSNLLVVPGASAGNYNLTLLGTGSNFNASVNFVTSSGVASVPLQGTLASGENVTAVLDFRQSATTSTFAITGIDRLFGTSLSLQGSLTSLAASLASLAARSDLVSGLFPQLGAGQGNEDEQATSEVLVLYAADRTVATFSVPEGLGVWELTVIEINDAAKVPGVARLTAMSVVRTAQTTRLVLVFHRALDAAQVANPANFVLADAGPNGTLGDGDDRPIAIDAAKIHYEADERRVTIDAGPLAAGRYQLQLKLAAPVAGNAAGGQAAAFEIRPAEAAQAARPETVEDWATEVDRHWERWSQEAAATVPPPTREQQIDTWFEQLALARNCGAVE